MPLALHSTTIRLPKVSLRPVFRAQSKLRDQRLGASARPGMPSPVPRLLHQHLAKIAILTGSGRRHDVVTLNCHAIARRCHRHAYFPSKRAARSGLIEWTGWLAGVRARSGCAKEELGIGVPWGFKDLRHRAGFHAVCGQSWGVRQLCPPQFALRMPNILRGWGVVQKSPAFGASDFNGLTDTALFRSPLQ